jgi:hypothetical protein
MGNPNFYLSSATGNTCFVLVYEVIIRYADDAVVEWLWEKNPSPSTLYGFYDLGGNVVYLP